MRYAFEKIGIHIVAFLVARCEMFGMYPFVVPFFMAAYIQQRSSFSMYLVMMLGVISTNDYVSAFRYSLIIWFLMVLLKRTDRQKLFADNQQIALACGVVLWAISMPYSYVVLRDAFHVVYIILEGVIATCFTLILEEGLVAMRVGTSRIFASNERFIGVFVVLILVLFGCPVMESPVHILLLVCALLLLVYSYRFDSGVGVATGAVTGLILAVRMDNVNYLGIMIVLSGFVLLLKDVGKAGMLLAFLSGYVAIGYVYEPELMQKQMLLAVLFASAIVLLLPRSVLKAVNTVPEGITDKSQDLLIQEATRNKIEEFGKAFVYMEKMLQQNEAKQNSFEPQGLSNIYLSGDGISLLNVVESRSNRLAELRRNFIRQIGQVGDVITSFPVELAEDSMQTVFFEGRLSDCFGRMGVVVTKSLFVKDKENRMKVYVSCYRNTEKMIKGAQLAVCLGSIVGKDMCIVDCGEVPVAKAERMYCFVEEGNFFVTVGVVRRNRQGEMLCGDNFSVVKIDVQKILFMLSDGMGTGFQANEKSQQVVELLEQLLASGFRKELAVQMLNSFMSFLVDGTTSSSVDLGVLDLYNGELDLMKLGAATTFIKKGKNVECVRSTSLPMGFLEQVEFDTCVRKLYHGDMIVMVSDGVIDNIVFEDKEEYLADIIARETTTNAQLAAEHIIDEVEHMRRQGMKDDGTILVVGVWDKRKKR